MITAEVPRERVRAVKDAYDAHTGGDLPYERAEPLAAHGWTAETVAQVVAMGRDAMDRQTAIERERYANWGDRWTLRVVCDRLRREAAAMADLGLPLPRALDWLAVLAACPTQEALAGLTLVDGDRARAAEVARVTWFASWESAAGVLAPLAFAAGLTVTEAQTRRAAGTLAEAELRTLAALRGYRLLDFGAAPSSLIAGGVRP